MIDLNATLKISPDSASEMHFAEVQQFRQVWIRIALGIGLIGLLFLCSYQLVTQHIILSVAPLAMMGGILIGFFVFISKVQLHTTIDSSGITYRYYPFQLKSRFVSWSEVEDIYIREFDALIEYGGWGARYSSRGNAYIVSGKYGLQMELSDERKILISTTRPIELERVILKFGYNYEIR